jgi:hypothetical protein
MPKILTRCLIMRSNSLSLLNNLCFLSAPFNCYMY